MRNALILLAVVALIILAAGAFNNGVVFDIDYVAGTASSVSLFWVSLVVAAIVFVTGLFAAWFALAGASGGRRKLEAELQSTYERLRETERDAEQAKSAAAVASAAAALPAPSPEVTVVAEREDATAALAEAPTIVDGEARTFVVDETATAVVDEAPADVAGDVAAGESQAEPSLEEPTGEQTAVTVIRDGDDGAGETPGEAASAADETTVAPGDTAAAAGDTVVTVHDPALDGASPEPDAGAAPGRKE